MTIVVSIILYAGSCFFALVLGATAEQYKHGRANSAQGKFGFISMLVLFVLAACLQVAA